MLIFGKFRIFVIIETETDMRIKSIILKNRFKRFTKLTIGELPPSARLVMMVGPNGSGKSSVFEAMNVFARQNYHGINQQFRDYYVKTDSSMDEAERGVLFNQMGQNVDVQLHPSGTVDWRNGLHIRTAYRNVPSVGISQLNKVNESQEANRLLRLIDNDAALSLNLQRIAWQAWSDLNSEKYADMTARQIKERIIGKIRSALSGILSLHFDGLDEFDTEHATFRFTKGNSGRFAYENLSSGEKAAFDLILDFAIKQEKLTNAIYCIDEPEVHTNPRIHKGLLDALYRLTPTDSQLWVATHSFGMMKQAWDLKKSRGDEVVFLDFSKGKFDAEAHIRPEEPTPEFWRKMHHIALEDMADLIAPETIILCEGFPDSRPRDADCYNRIFSDEYADVFFVSAGGKGEAGRVVPVLKAVVKGVNVLRLRDKDNLSPSEVTQKQREGLKILNRRELENYLLDDEVLRALCEKHKQPDKAAELIELRQGFGDLKDGKPKDALTPIRKWATDKLGIRNAGSDNVAFAYDTLAPLIKPGMAVYEELKKCIFG